MYYVNFYIIRIYISIALHLFYFYYFVLFCFKRFFSIKYTAEYKKTHTHVIICILEIEREVHPIYFPYNKCFIDIYIYFRAYKISHFSNLVVEFKSFSSAVIHIHLYTNAKTHTHCTRSHIYTKRDTLVNTHCAKASKEERKKEEKKKKNNFTNTQTQHKNESTECKYMNRTFIG